MGDNYLKPASEISQNDEDTIGGDDFLFGYAGADLMHGGEGNDALYGGTGSDTMYG